MYEGIFIGKVIAAWAPLMHECKAFMNLGITVHTDFQAPHRSLLGSPHVSRHPFLFVMYSCVPFRNPRMFLSPTDRPHTPFPIVKLTIIHPFTKSNYIFLFFFLSCLPAELVYRQESRPSVSMRNDSELCCRHEQTGSQCQVSSRNHLKTRFRQA